MVRVIRMLGFLRCFLIPTYHKILLTLSLVEFIYGFLGRDSYGLTDQLIVKNFTFDQVNTTINVLFDGALGLGLGSEDNGETSSLQAAYDQGLIDKPIFTLYLARNDLWDPDTKGQVAGRCYLKITYIFFEAN